jgi:hypothetical protein
MGAHPALGCTPQSGPGFTIPKGIDGPGNVRPTPTLPIRGSTYFQVCASVRHRQQKSSIHVAMFLIVFSSFASLNGKYSKNIGQSKTKRLFYMPGCPYCKTPATIFTKEQCPDF